jgi:hypothetical protein
MMIKVFANLYKIFILPAFVAVLLNSSVCAAGQDSRLVEERFRFYYDERDSILINQLISRVRPSLNELEQFFQKRPSSEIRIIIAKSEEEYFRQARVPIPEWSQAIAFTADGKIIMNLSSAEAIQSSPAILVHELWHIFLRMHYPDARVPVWLNEGLAQYFEREQLGFENKRKLATALSTGRLIDLMSLDTVFTFGPVRARLAYIEALSAVMYLIRQHGLESVRTLLGELNKGSDLDTAFLNTVGYDFIDFEIRWNQFLSDEYKWLVVLNFDNLLWGSIGLLFVLALVVKIWRSRRTMKQWDDEDDDENLGQDHERSAI